MHLPSKVALSLVIGLDDSQEVDWAGGGGGGGGGDGGGDDGDGDGGGMMVMVVDNQYVRLIVEILDSFVALIREQS